MTRRGQNAKGPAGAGPFPGIALPYWGGMPPVPRL
jgi:hypothetical protein